MAGKKIYILISTDWCNGTKRRVYDSFDKARAVMDKEVKSHMKKLKSCGWEIDYHKVDCARIHLLTHFFDKNDSWNIVEGQMMF